MTEEDDRAEYEEMVLVEVREEELRNRPVFQSMRAVRFTSYSKGRGIRRKQPKEIIFVSYGLNGGWSSWSGEDRTDGGRNPWDVWATDVIKSGDVVATPPPFFRPILWSLDRRLHGLEGRLYRS